ncbi:hypothetical protein F4604DRAFT_1682243 [Suillus subluteus]|nr:hypothetical protein F4604DRAFT_1682243 [Suillus subluteus]
MTLFPLHLAGISQRGPLLWLRRGAVYLTATTTIQTKNNSTMVHEPGYGYGSRRSGEGRALPVSYIPEEGSAGYGDGHRNSGTNLSPPLADDCQPINNHDMHPNNIDPQVIETPSPNATQAYLHAMHSSTQGSPLNLAQNAHTNQPNKSRKGRKTHANIKVASLNMRGRWHNNVDKWPHINQLTPPKPMLKE